MFDKIKAWLYNVTPWLDTAFWALMTCFGIFLLVKNN